MIQDGFRVGAGHLVRDLLLLSNGILSVVPPRQYGLQALSKNVIPTRPEELCFEAIPVTF